MTVCRSLATSRGAGPRGSLSAFQLSRLPERFGGCGEVTTLTGTEPAELLIPVDDELEATSGELEGGDVELEAEAVPALDVAPTDEPEASRLPRLPPIAPPREAAKMRGFEVS